jgi:MarR family transcriptional regulator, organic hydroperoxide resistance regulator
MTKREDAQPPLPTRLSGPAESPGFLLWKISNAWQRAQRLALQPLGLTHSQFVVLAAVTWFGASETLTQARVAQLTGIDPMTTSQVLRALETAALIERHDHPSDPRAKQIAATRAGRDLARKAVVVVEETDAAFFQPVAQSNSQLIKLFQALVQGNERAEAGEGR